MCYEAFEEDPFCLEYLPDWFVTQQINNMWHDDYFDNENFGVNISSYQGYQRRKALQTKIEKELMRIACGPSVWWKVCS